ncbi:MAG: type IV pilus biogenesis/stability protein PilW [Burkholderiales bacterium]
MKRLGLALLMVAAGCATQPAPEPIAETGVITGETGDPRNRARIHTELASLYFERGNMGVALEELRVATTADPSYALAHGMFGLVYMELRETQLAEQSFQRGLGLAPQDSNLNHNYGWFLCQTSRENEAIKYFMQAIRNPLYTSPGRSFAAAGICALRKNEIKDAEQYFLRALRIDPDDPASLLQLGQIRYRQASYDESRQFVSRFNKLVEPTPESLWLALRIERKVGERIAEANFAGQLRRRYPGSREYQLLQRGEFD